MFDSLRFSSYGSGVHDTGVYFLKRLVDNGFNDDCDFAQSINSLSSFPVWYVL